MCTMDTGNEFTSKALDTCAEKQGIKPEFTE
jgi:hypothetical protein